MTLDRREVLNKFRRSLVVHEEYQRCSHELVHVLQSAPDGSVFVLTGPTGVGKSTMLRNVARVANNAVEKKCTKYPDRGPVAEVEVPATSNRNEVCTWRELYARILHTLDEVLVGKKRLTDPSTRDFFENMTRMRRDRTTRALRESVENCLRYRRPLAVFFDEAHHMIKGLNGMRLDDQFDVIKSLANLSGTRLVLFGPYPILQLAYLSGQNARRTDVIHFPRYSTKHVHAFIDAAHTILESLEIPHTVDPVKRWEDLYACSAGCIGILKDWIGNALAGELESKRPRLEWAGLMRKRKPDKALLVIAQEIREGEAFFGAGSIQAVRTSLGLTHPASTVVQGASKPQKGRRPGERLPVRDTVGKG